MFENNTAAQGGHMYVNNSSTVNIENSTFVNGHAITFGGAIMNAMDTGTINIISVQLQKFSRKTWWGN